MALADTQPENISDVEEINHDDEEILDQIDISDLEIEPIEDFGELESPETNIDLIPLKREDTRGRLALAFLIGFFTILIIGMIIAAFNPGDKVVSVREVLLAISGILSGPLGFVIGYYFRSSEEN
ncbi:hypothetical protein KC909_03860 [Candidatus Dojkabacteria bacterium]|uniref:Uncharacterized protein n=1 Tax=Candidatus Dojkabacteria bacterium TaxID=2099670 RepID=A0A955L694_9BACT|nr:hypothetical protein [Candidatus Dojkabacteria bacterium]